MWRPSPSSIIRGVRAFAKGFGDDPYNIPEFWFLVAALLTVLPWGKSWWWLWLRAPWIPLWLVCKANLYRREIGAVVLKVFQSVEFWFLIALLLTVLPWGKSWWWLWLRAAWIPLWLLWMAKPNWKDVRAPVRQPEFWTERFRLSIEIGCSLRTFWRSKYKYALVLLVLFTVLVKRLDDFGWYQQLEFGILNTFAIWEQNRMDESNAARSVYLVEITDADYQNKELFKEHSPLDPVLITKLIDAVWQGNPAVIGVDLDTRSDSETWRKELAGHPEWMNDKNDKPKIIWAVVPETATSEKDSPLVLDCVLGGNEGDIGQVGIVRFPQDSDGVVRRYRSQYRVKGSLPNHCPTKEELLAESGNNTSSRGAFYQVVIDECKKEKPCQLPQRTFAESWDEKYLRFGGEQNPLQIVQSSEFLGGGTRITENALQGKIVLIGGHFAAARDDYMTPVGRMAGVELLANAIISEADHPAVHPAKYSCAWFADFIIDLLMGSWIVLVYHVWKYSPGIALVISLLSILVPFFLSALTFLFLAIWLNAAPIMLGAMIHEMCESSHVSREVLAPRQ